MTERDQQLQARLLATFKEEAQEHTAAMTRQLLLLETAAPADALAAVETAFREAHSLKGAARTVNLRDIESLCQGMESVFDAMKRGQLAPGPELLDLLLQAARTLEQLPATLDQEASADKTALNSIILSLQGVLMETPSLVTGGFPSPGPIPSSRAGSHPPAAGKVVPLPAPRSETPRDQDGLSPRAADSTVETVRVPSAKLDALFWQAEELLSAKLVSGQLAVEAGDLRGQFSHWQKQWSRMQLDTNRMQRMVENGAGTIPGRDVARLLDFLDWNRALLEEMGVQATRLSGSTAQHQRSLSVGTGQLLDNARQLLMLPCSWLLDTLRPLVRELARAQSKEIDLEVEGDDLEMDRRVLAELKVPLIHLLRNAVDHGIEHSKERLQSHKPPRGTLRLFISQIDGNRVVMRVQDDGRGMDLKKVRRAAEKAQLLRKTESRDLDEKAALNLLFQSGLSTSPMITEISGRGLGMTIVREKVERLDGTVTLENHPGGGMTVSLEVPLTLATFRGVLVRVADQFFVVPETKVDRVGRMARDRIQSIENHAAIELNGASLALVWLGEVLGLPHTRAEPAGQNRITFLVLQTEPVRVAFVVDEICGEQEVLVKGLGAHLRGVRNMAGATVLGDGRVALILDVRGLIRDAVRLGDAGPVSAVPPPPAAPGQSRRKSVLVVEDSITSRTLLKNILESSDYAVTTAVDGVDALTKLRNESFDLVVTDVDMPHMNGFVLTSRIRADRKLAEIPVVLVTALDTREDRERGIDVGASAYIVKTSFNQSNLLEVIGRLA